ncbi:MAG: AMP-binding protein [Pigmentiphaga sp.]|nr:AMP-binding protein [Pigmentiphaga sp.]
MATPFIASPALLAEPALPDLGLLRSHDDVKRVNALPYTQYMPFTSTYQALEASARCFGERPALTFWSSPDPAEPGRTWTHRSLFADIQRTARWFQTLAGGERPRVAMLLPAIPDAYLTLWGAEAVGVACPMNYLLGARHLAELVTAADCNILVALGPCDDLAIWELAAPIVARCASLKAVVRVAVDQASAGQAAGGEPLPAAAKISGQIPGSRSPEGAAPRQVPVLAFAEGLAGQPAGMPREWRPPVADDLAAVFHTGGTTGTPKLARHLHRNQLHAARGAAWHYGMTADDSIINGFPLFHVAGSLVYGLSTLMTGGHLYLPTLLGFRNTGFMRRYWEFVGRHRITLATAVPTGIATLLAMPHTPEQLHSVRAMLTGGAPLPDALADECEQRLGIPVRNTLGMTESAGVIGIEPVAAPRRRGSCGWPLPHTEVEIVDPETLLPVPTGEIGMLRARGPHISPGYTEAGRNPGTFQDGWLLSGDLARQDEEGRVYVMGRTKDVIIRNSHNLDPQQIEEAMLAHPGVQMAAAVGQPDEYAGELPMVYVVPRPRAALDVEALLAHARATVPERPAWPKRIEIVEALPQTAVGKVYKPELRRRAILWVLADRVRAAGLEGKVTVECRDQGRGLAVRLVPTAGEGEALHDRLRQLMRRFSLSYHIAGDTANRKGAAGADTIDRDAGAAVVTNKGSDHAA